MRIKSLQVLLILLTFTSCLQQETKKATPYTQSPDTQLHIMRSDQFQWFLRGYSIWDSRTFAKSDLIEQASNKSFTIMRIFDSYTINEKGIKYKLIKTFDETEYYKLIDIEENEICNIYPNHGEGEYSFTIKTDDEVFTTNESDRGTFQISMELKGSNVNQAKFTRELNYFSDILYIETQADTSHSFLLISIATAIIFNNTVFNEFGRYR